MIIYVLEISDVILNSFLNKKDNTVMEINNKDWFN